MAERFGPPSLPQAAIIIKQGDRLMIYRVQPEELLLEDLRFSDPFFRQDARLVPEPIIGITLRGTLVDGEVYHGPVPGQEAIEPAKAIEGRVGGRDGQYLA